jgi:hypothetical protein
MARPSFVPLVLGVVTQEGTLRLDAENRRLLAGWLTTLRNVTVEVVVRKHKSTRSDLQNRWYWGQVMHLISEHTGHTPEEIHEYCKARFLPKHVALCDGNGVVIDDRVVGGSTTQLTTAEMADYCEAIRAFALESLGVAIPDPDPNWREAVA